MTSLQRAVNLQTCTVPRGEDPLLLQRCHTTTRAGSCSCGRCHFSSGFSTSTLFGSTAPQLLANHSLSSLSWCVPPPLPQHRLIQQGRACVRACERACVLACLRGWKLAAFRCILLWSRLPNFVSTVSALSILTRMMLATQRNNQLEPGSLLDFLHGNGPRSLPLSQLLHVAEQIASGMAYLESVRIIHCCECRGSLFCWASADPIATRSTLRGRERERVCVCVCEFV